MQKKRDKLSMYAIGADNHILSTQDQLGTAQQRPTEIGSAPEKGGRFGVGRGGPSGPPRVGAMALPGTTWKRIGPQPTPNPGVRRV